MSKLLRACLATGFLLAAEALSAAEPPTKAPPSEKADAERIARFITQLGGSRFAERETATRELDALGSAALEGLRRATEADDAEVRRRAQKLIRQIEQRLTTARLLEPRRVRFVYQDVPVIEAVSDLARKTGMPLRLAGDTAPVTQRRLTLDTGDTSFWDAFAQFCRKAGLTERSLDAAALRDDRYEYNAGERRIVALDRTVSGSSARPNSPVLLTEGKWQELPTCHTGAIRIRALPPGSASPGVSPAAGETLVVLEAIPEPHLHWLSVLAVRVNRVLDDKDRTLKQPVMVGGVGPAGRGAEELLIIWDGVGEFPATPFGDARHVPVRFRLADSPSHRLKELSGTIAAQVQAPPEPLATVANILEAAGQTVRCADGSSLRVVEAVRTDDGDYRVRVTLTSPPPELINSGVPARVVVFNRVRWGRGTGDVTADGADFALLDAQGRRLPLANGEVLGALNKGVVQSFTLLYQPLPDRAAPARLVYNGRRVVTVEVPFTLKDVPLP